MTCIVGLITPKNTVILGVDSLASNGIESTVRMNPKAFTLQAGADTIGIATCGSIRMKQVLHYRLTVPPIDTWDTWRWASTTFIDAVRAAFKDAGWGLKDSDGSDKGGSFLVAARGQLIEVESDFQVGIGACKYAAMGSGGSVALGALHATKGLEPEVRVTKALEAAAEHACGVRGPFLTIEV